MDGEPTEDPGIRDDSDTLPARWYWTRFELAIGIVVVLAIGVVAWSAPVMFGETEKITLGPLEMRLQAFSSIAALVIAVPGLVWMIRIFRGPRDEPPRWRYRDR